LESSTEGGITLGGVPPRLAETPNPSYTDHALCGDPPRARPTAETAPRGPLGLCRSMSPRICRSSAASLTLQAARLAPSGWILEATPPLGAFTQSATVSHHPTGMIYSDPPLSTSSPTSRDAEIWPQTICFVAELGRLRLCQGMHNFKTRAVRRTIGTSRVQEVLASEAVGSKCAHEICSCLWGPDPWPFPLPGCGIHR
jgi:hypothetical protein